MITELNFTMRYSDIISESCTRAGKKEVKLQGIPHYNRVSEIALLTRVGNSNG